VFWRSAGDPDVTFSQILKEICLAPIPAGSLRAREQGVAARWPAALDIILGQCLQREPAKRYAHAGFLWANLKEALLPLCPPESSQRVMLAAVPSSARVLAGAAPANALDETMTPAPPPALPPPPPILIEPPPRAGKALLSASFGGAGEVRGVPIRAFVGGIAALAFVGLFLYLNHARNRSPASEPRPSDEIPSEPKNLVPGPPRPAARCRLCTVDVSANGPLAKDEITRSVEAAIPMLAAQCVPRDGRGRARARATAGSAIIAFTVREGRAVNRRNVGGDGECFSRAMGDVPFPRNDVGTDVTYTLRFDPYSD
jgi:hypothetical protein